ncbi:MAG: PaaI family thioesterase [Actinomycetota bacterium]
MVTDEPIRGVFAYLEHPGILALDGMEQMRRWLRKDYPFPPIWYVAASEQVESGPGMSTWTLPVTPWLQSAAGTLTGGVLAFAADAPLGSALFTTLPPGTWLSTSELSIHFLRPPAADSGAIITRARLIQAGKSQGLSEGTLEDAEGHLLAHATARNMVTALPAPPAAEPPNGRIPWPQYEGPHPFERPAEGETVPQAVWDDMSGMEMMAAWKKGELPVAPLSNLVGASHMDFGEGWFSVTFPASLWWTTAGGAFYGGALALFLDYAMHGAIHTTLPSGTSWGTLDLKVNFLRPVTPDGSDLRATAKTIHRGNRIAVTSAELTDQAGKTIALANASTMLLPGRPWRPASPPAPLDETVVDG